MPDLSVRLDRIQALRVQARAALLDEDFLTLGALDQDVRLAVRSVADVGSEAPERLALVHEIVEDLLGIYVRARQRLEADRGEAGDALGKLSKGRRAAHAYGRG